MALPEGQRTLEATVARLKNVESSGAGAPMTAELGVGIVADFANDPAVATTQLRAVKLPGCGGGI